VIHALFWLGVYYALEALTASSYSMVIDHGKGAFEQVAMSFHFAYSGAVLVSLMLMFYGSVFWLFKKVIRFKSDLRRVAAIAGWCVLLFVINFLLVSLLIGSHEEKRHAPNIAMHATRVDTAVPATPRVKVFFESRSDTVRPGKDSFPNVPPPLPGLFPENDWLRMQLPMAVIFLSILAIAAAYFFIKEWIQSDLTRSQAETQHLQTEIRLLRSQVNPHFFFNTLNNLFSMAQKKGHEDLADSISKLSGMMRYMIYESNTDTVPLQREIVYLEDCIALNKLRYADGEVAVSFGYPGPAVAAGV
ncbi:MAG: histidine kinase, partial [Chitinophaga rupis]